MGRRGKTVYIATSPAAIALYTQAVLRALCAAAGVPVTSNPDEADAIWVSACNPDDLPTVIGARKLARGRPVVMGGAEAFCGEPYLAWCDAVVVGEGWEFIEAWGRDPDQAMDLPCVLTRAREAWASYVIPWESVPMFRAQNRYFYLAGRGCKNKCRFCFTSWTSPHMSNTPARIRQAEARAARNGCKIYVVSNDSDEIDVEIKNRAALSVMARDYAKNPARYKSALVRLGIERWTEEHRRAMSKPIPDRIITRVVESAEAHGQNMQLFMITGYPGWTRDNIEQFREVLPPSAAVYPRIRIKMTMFEPTPWTPWALEPVRDGWVDADWCLRTLNFRCKMIRILPGRSSARAAWTVALRRSSPEEAIHLGRPPKLVYGPGTLEKFRYMLEQKGLAHLLDFQPTPPNARVHTVYEANLRRIWAREYGARYRGGAPIESGKPSTKR